MSEMIERVARALWSKAKEEPVRRSVGVSFENDPLKPWWIDQARAAIGAMREPTQAMRDAMNDDIDWDGDAVRAYVAGIDAALTEEK